MNFHEACGYSLAEGVRARTILKSGGVGPADSSVFNVARDISGAVDTAPGDYCVSSPSRSDKLSARSISTGKLSEPATVNEQALPCSPAAIPSRK